MGQFMSTNRIYGSNDELTNALIKSEIIFTKDVEEVFRCVDRGFYFTNQEKPLAYRDTAWQSDSIHLSAPSIYASVLECLNLHQGNKFLNIGSGIGYLSTVAGLLLGVNGVNHGIEINQLVIEQAYQKIDDFKLNAAAIDYYNFCEPVFIHGNVCELMSMGYYDKVYCGASVPPKESEFLKSLISVGGILVMPLNGFLLKITRKDAHTWQTDKVLEVSFSNLVIPEKCSFKTVKFPSVEPLSLQELCRSSIRTLLRKNLNRQFPNLTIHTKCQLKIEEYKAIDSDDQTHQPTPLCPFNGVNRNGVLRDFIHFVDTFAILEGAISDVGSESEDEIVNSETEEEDENNDRHRTVEDEHGLNPSSRTFTDTTDESAKRKSLEAGTSDQNKTVEDKENPKRMKMDSTQKSEGVPSTSSDGDSDLWETISSSSTQFSFDSEAAESWVSPSARDIDNNIEHGLPMNPWYYSNNPESSLDEEEEEEEEESDTDSEDSADSFTYKFINGRTENELSILLKDKINSLPIPVQLKHFLNYNRTN